VIFHLPPSTYVFAKLARISMKEGLILSLKEISKVGCCLSDNRGTNYTREDGEQDNP
jgi:hypothetical protein